MGSHLPKEVIFSYFWQKGLVAIPWFVSVDQHIKVHSMLTFRLLQCLFTRTWCIYFNTPTLASRPSFLLPPLNSQACSKPQTFLPVLTVLSYNLQDFFSHPPRSPHHWALVSLQIALAISGLLLLLWILPDSFGVFFLWSTIKTSSLLWSSHFQCFHPGSPHIMYNYFPNTLISVLSAIYPDMGFCENYSDCVVNYARKLGPVFQGIHTVVHLTIRTCTQFPICLCLHQHLLAFLSAAVFVTCLWFILPCFNNLSTGFFILSFQKVSYFKWKTQKVDGCL